MSDAPRGGRLRDRREPGGPGALTIWTAVAAIVVASTAGVAGLGLLLARGDDPPPRVVAAPSPDDASRRGDAGVGTAGTPTVPPAPTLTPDLPDLSLEAVFSRDNELVVVIANRGAGAFEGTVLVKVAGGASHRLDAGAPLAPGAIIESHLDGEYAQRRASVEVAIEPVVPTAEESVENNRRIVTVTPDRPNDLVLAGAELDADEGEIHASVRNDSPIPLVGVVTVAVRRTHPRSELLGRASMTIRLAPSATATVTVTLAAAGGGPPDPAPTLGGLLVILSAAEAIHDANPLNDVFPRTP